MNTNKDSKKINFYSKEFLSHRIHILECESMVELMLSNQMLIHNEVKEDKHIEEHLLTVMV
jgi:hypothetical protein